MRRKAGALFYFYSVLLGYALFRCLPFAYEAIGFGYAESSLLIVAAINIHHFIVDAFIWKVRKPATRRVAATSF